MKKRLLFILLIFFSTISIAKEVTVEQASQVGFQLMKTRVKGFSGSIKYIEVMKQTNTKASLYIINFVPQGWIMISADDTSKPLLAYSPQGSFSLKKALPDNLNGWLQSYSQEIEKNAESGIAPLKDWEISQINRTTRAIGNKIDPFIQVGWNQDTPYNQYCPQSAGKRMLVGCVAVAMAQAMSVAQHPAKPNGEHSYSWPGLGTIMINYNTEPPYNWTNIMNGTNDQYKEVARLLYHCGVSVDMQYGLDGSGTYTELVPDAMKKYFSYSNVQFIEREDYNGDWTQLIINELQAGRPIVYCGQDIKKGVGHCFNLDGYDGDRMFHVNWGWSNYGNAYYSIDALRDNYMGMDYTAGQGMVIGIAAPSDKPLNIRLSNTTIESGLLAGSTVGDVSVESNATGHEYTFEVRGKYNSVTGKYKPVPFFIEEGKLKTSESLTAGNKEIEIVVTDKSNNTSLAQGFTIVVTGNSSAQKTIEESTSFSFNKSTGLIAIQTKQNVSYAVLTESGEEVYRGKVTTDPLFYIDTHALTTGVYKLEFFDDKDSKSLRFIVKEYITNPSKK